MCSSDLDKQKFINFVYLLKEPAFTLIDLCYCFLCFCFIYFCSDLYDFFPSTDFGFSLVLLSLVVLSVGIDGLFEIFLFS